MPAPSNHPANQPAIATVNTAAETSSDENTTTRKGKVHSPSKMCIHACLGLSDTVLTNAVSIFMYARNETDGGVVVMRQTVDTSTQPGYKF